MRLAYCVLLLAGFCCHLSLFSQPEVQAVRKGNKAYMDKRYTDAEAEYKKSLDVKANMPEAVFNLGAALYRQEDRLDEAAGLFTLSAKANVDSLVRAKAHHNLGNILLKQQKYAEAAAAFKQSLKINPRSEETRYNLAYALAMKKNQDQSGKDKNQQDKQQDQQKDQNKQDQNQDQKQNQQNQDRQDKSSPQDKPSQGDKGSKPQISKEDAQKLLEALQREEQKAQQKMMLQQMPPKEGKVLKDW